MPNLESAALNLIIESLPTGTIIVDSQGRIVRLNHQAESWFGYQRDEILGQSVELLIPDRFRSLHPQFRADYMEHPRVRPMGINRDLYARRKDGSEFPCDISLHPLPLQNDMHILVHIVDSTERRLAEARQRHEESLRRMQFMVENLPAGAVYVSLDTQTILVNRTFEEMTGYTADELTHLSRSFVLLFRDRADEVRQLHDADKKAGFRSSRELQFFRKDGRQAWIEMAAYRYNNHEVWLWHDITDRLAAQERLVQSARLAAIGEMMTGLAHESRNALQRARAALEMLELDLAGRPEMLTLSLRAVSAIEELQRLYEEVRNYAAPIQLELRDVDLEDVWTEVWSQVQQVHRDKEIRLTSQGNPETRQTRIDVYRIQQVFRNILENAVAVLPPVGGVIEISSRRVDEENGHWMEIAVQDNGPGMNREQMARIFEPFFTTKTRGTGLGMAIVKRIMEAHGGSASIGTPDQGARIILRFPDPR